MDESNEVYIGKLGKIVSKENLAFCKIKENPTLRFIKTVGGSLIEDDKTYDRKSKQTIVWTKVSKEIFDVYITYLRKKDRKYLELAKTMRGSK